MSNPLKVLADENIPGLDLLFGDQLDISYTPGRAITAEQVKGFDALLVRSVTTVDSQLLSGSSIKFLGSCTIGTDHVDLPYLAQENIAFSNAPGCNAVAVVDYVLAAMLEYKSDLGYWREKTVGIIGFGQVGSRLYQRLADLGIQTRCYDPFVGEASDDLSAVLACDCISCHVPLTHDKPFSTYHMISADSLDKMKAKTLFINTSRGAVVDNLALKDRLHSCSQPVVLDVFENEPLADAQLLPLLFLATPHIAGYSQQGKIRGSIQVGAALADYFKIAMKHQDILQDTTTSQAAPAIVKHLIDQVFPIEQQSQQFVKGFLSCASEKEQAAYFDRYRKNYPLRSEWQYIKLLSEGSSNDESRLSALGFSLQQ